MANFEIIAIGGGAIWERAFNAIAMVMGASTYQSLMLVAALSGFAVMGWMIATGKSDLKMGIRWFCGLVIVMDLLIAPKVTVHIRDEIAAATGQGAAIYSVSNVPLSLAVIAEISTQASFELTRMFETAFGATGNNADMVNISNLSGTGLMFAARLVNSTKQLTITNPELSENIKHYVMQCVIPEIVHNNLTVKEAVESNDVWQVFQDAGSPARRFTYANDGSQSFALCNDKNVIGKMNDALSTEIQGAPSQLAKLIGLPHKKDNAAQQKAVVLSYIPAAYNLLSKSNQNDGASSIIQQAMMANVLNDAFLTIGGNLDSSAMINSYMHIKTGAQSALQSNETAYQASMVLPWLHIIFSVLLFSLFPIVIVTMVIPGNAKRLNIYASALLWLALWAPISSVLQMIYNDTFSLVALASMQHASSNSLIMSQNLMWAVPMIASVLAFGNYYALNQLVGNAAGGEQSIANQAAGEAVTGNYSANNMQIGNESIYNENAFKADTNFASMRGQVALQGDNGAVINHLGDGRNSIQSSIAMSSMPLRLNMSDIQHKELDRRYQESLSDTQQNMESYVESATSAIHKMLDFSENVANSENSDATITAGESINHTKGMRSANEMINEFSREHGLLKEDTKSLIASAAVEVGVGVSMPFVHAKMDLSSKAESAANLRDHESYNDAKKLVQSQQFQESIDQVSHAVKEDHFRGSNEASARLSDGINTDLSRAVDAGHHVQASMEKSEMYQNGIQYSKNHSSQIDSERGTELINWLKDQEDISTGQPIGIAKVSDIIHNQPEKASEYAQQYMSQLPDNYILSEAKTVIDAKQNHIAENFNANKSTIKSAANIEEKHAENTNQVIGQEKAKEVFINVANSLSENTAKREFQKAKSNGDFSLDKAQSDRDIHARTDEIQGKIKEGSEHPIKEIAKPLKYKETKKDD